MAAASLVRYSLCVSLALLSVASCRAQAIPTSSLMWTLDNGVIRKTLTFTPQSGLETSEWRDLQSGYDFTSRDLQPKACKEFSFTADDQAVSGSAHDVRFVAAERTVDASGTMHLTLKFQALHAPLLVVLQEELGATEPAIRQYLYITNQGTSPTLLRHLAVACGALSPGPEKDLIAFGGYGTEPRETFFTGRVNDVAVLLENAKTGVGVALLNETPGYLKRIDLGNIGWLQWVPGFSVGYDTDLFPFERTLQPQESFTTAAVSVLAYRRGTAADPHWRIPTFVHEVIEHNRSKQPQWIYNTWEPFHKEINATLLKEIIPHAAANGFTLLALDDGWEERYGDYSVNATRFPLGLDPVFAESDALGMKRGLWIPLALVDTNSPIFLRHPEWACFRSNGKPQVSQGAGVVMSLASPYRQAVIDQLIELVARYHLDYIKVDLTTVFNTYGEQPGCFDKNAPSQSPQESSERIYEALDEVAATLHRRFPNLQIDYTFELWGEKHLIDYGLLHVADLDWMSNVRDLAPEDAGPLQARTLLYQRAMAIPVDAMLIGNLQAEIAPWQGQVATAMGAGPVFLGDLRRQSSDVAAKMRDWIARYQVLRNTADISASFFPLGSWQQPRSDRWDGYARFAHDGQGIIVLFHNDSSATGGSVTVPGFPDGNFTLTSWVGAPPIALEGAALRTGIILPFVATEHVAVFEVRRAAPSISHSNKAQTTSHPVSISSGVRP